MKSSEGVVEWQLVGVANSSQPGSDERVRGRIEKMKQFFREASKDTASHLVSPDDRDDKVQRLIQALQQRDVEADVS